MPTAAPVPLVVAPPVNETTIWQVSVRPDSPEIGTPGKNGALKIYIDFLMLQIVKQGSGLRSQ